MIGYELLVPLHTWHLNLKGLIRILSLQTLQRYEQNSILTLFHKQEPANGILQAKSNQLLVVKLFLEYTCAHSCTYCLYSCKKQYSPQSLEYFLSDLYRKFVNQWMI